MYRFFTFLALLTVLSPILIQKAQALPRFALLYGTSCASCHSNLSGGGMRNEGGWYSMKPASLVDPSETFLSPLYAAESNSLLVDQLSWGFDIRNQTAKRRHIDEVTGIPDIERQNFFMQVSPYVSYRPVEEVEIYGSYNVVEPEFAGQQKFTAAVTYRPFDEVAVKGGYIQPEFGIRHDDHTIFTRQGSKMWVMYQELGTEVYVTPQPWLTVSGGIYDSKHRREVYPTVIKDGSLIYTSKISAQPVLFDEGIGFLAGASMMIQDGQNMYGGHLGVGLIDHATLLAELVQWKNDAAGGSFEPEATMYSILASYQLFDGLALTARYERIQNDVAPGARMEATQYVIGAEIFPLPFLEIRPEYRWYDGKNPDTSTLLLKQYTAQVHIFY